ncbi:MAG: glycosyltransferase, partial [Pseudomonadota bacterium]
QYLAQCGWEVHFATSKQLPKSNTAIKIHRFSANRKPNKQIHHYLHSTESAILNAQGFARLAVELRQAGFLPDIIVAHSGWGSGSLAKSVWPSSKFVQYLEWWYNYPAWDSLEKNNNNNNLDTQAKTLFNNLPFYTDWTNADATIVPTRFQASAIPRKLRQNILVHHDGIDTTFFKPRDCASELRQKLGIPETAKIVTFATRGMEPHRGFPQFMESWAKLSATRKDVHCVIAGTDTVHYGPNLKEGDSYKKRVLETLDIDEARTHFVGRLPLNDYRDLLCASDCHVYLTVPFVLSWSLLEAMSCAAPIVSNKNESVREVMEDRTTGRLADLRNIDEIAAMIEEILDNPNSAQKYGQNARDLIIKKYSRSMIYPQKDKLFRKIAGFDAD